MDAIAIALEEIGLLLAQNRAARESGDTRKMARIALALRTQNDALALATRERYPASAA